MAKAYKCDRCRKVFDKKDTYKKGFSATWSTKIKTAEMLYNYNDEWMYLCPKCSKKLNDFLVSKRRKKAKKMNKVKAVKSDD